MRLFELFDRQGQGRLSWSDFFSGLTLCYYGSQQNLAALLFALYDQKLQLVLAKAQVQHLLESNSRYLAEKAQEGSEEGIELKFKEIRVEQWMKQSVQWIDYDKFRKLFGVFVQEQLQKQLGYNFSELNDLYNTSKGKYVGYLVNRKWFQSWRIFLQKEYDIELNGYAKFQAYTRTNKTIKTLRTKKTIKSLKSSRTINSGNSKKKITEIPKLKQLTLPPDLKISSSNFNIIHANIGDRPTEIRNNTLEGEFSQILAPGLIENVDYVILSEEVWGKLKLIYGAYPEFRRSGDTVIEIYPKTVKIYLQVHQGLIDYQRQKICEFSSMMEFKLLLQKALGFEEEQDKKQLEDYTFFIKHMNLRQWQVIEDLSCKVAELTAELLVFLAVVPNKDVQLFKRRYGHPTADANHLHIGDECIYYQGESGQAKRAVVVSQTKSKLVLHFKGSSYINDLCIDREILRNRVGVIKEDNVKKVRIEEGKLCGIPDGRGFDFINSVLLVLLSNEFIAKSLEQIPQSSGSSNLLQQLAVIYKMLTYGSPPKTLIAEFVRLYFPNFLHFQLAMAEEFLIGLFSKLNFNFGKFGNHVITQYKLQSEIVGYCNGCRRRNAKNQQYFVLTVPVAEEEVLYYEVIYVPFGYTINYIEQIRVKFSLPKNAKFQQYKKAFEKAAELKGVAYILVEIQGHDIIKNYLNAFPEATLEQLLLREEDKIYAYELCVKLDNFIADHYTTDPTIKARSLKQEQLIDFLKKNTVLADVTGKKLKGEEEDERVWSFGKIKNIQNERYTHKLSLRIEYRQKRGQLLQIQINPESQGVAPFPTQSYRFAQQYHIRCIQRVYNQVSNEMQLVNQPFVLMVASWMRLREIQLLVYQQIKDQIELHGRFRIDQPQSSKMGKKQRIKKFKEYLIKHKPYSIKFTDQEGRCGICYKIQKSKVFASQEEFTCDGNQDVIHPEDPVFWTLKPYQTRICIDWKSPFDFCMPEAVEHASAVQVQNAKKLSVQNLYSCLEQRFKQGDPQKCMFCRQEEGIQSWHQNITILPERIAILLDRANEETSKINKKLVSFEEEMILGCMVYQLTAVIALNNSLSVHQYLVYLRDKARWLQYEGELVRVIKKPAFQKVCALALFYLRVGKVQKK